MQFIMFLKRTKSKSYEYAQITESYRDKEGKTRHKVIANLGRIDQLRENGFHKIIAELAKLIDLKIEPSNTDGIAEMFEKERSNYGWLAYKKLWNKFKLDDLLSELVSSKLIEYDFAKTVFSMVINKLLAPSSKLALFENKNDYFYINDDLKLQNLYKSLDLLADNKEKIEDLLFARRYNLFNMSLDVVFYDVTTFYFESQTEDELKDYGFSKDNKINNVQVVMGLLIDRTGMPVGYELFKGCTIDSKTLVRSIKKLKERFNIDKVIIVADKGLNSGQNFYEIKKSGLDYIVSSRLKNMSKSIVDTVLDRNEYIKLNSTDTKEEFSYKSVNYKHKIKVIDESTNSPKYHELEEKLVCTYSSVRARKDLADRTRLIEKAKLIIAQNNKSALVANKGHKKYVTTKQDDTENNKTPNKATELELDNERILKEARFDGYYAIQTSRMDICPKEVIENYHLLYKIEDSFRVMKSNMGTRPVYHWTPKRIEGHFMMCFIAFLLEREMENIMKEQTDEKSTPGRIQKALLDMQVTQLEINNTDYYLRSKHDALAGRIFAKLKIKLPNNLSSKKDIYEYVSNI